MISASNSYNISKGLKEFFDNIDMCFSALIGVYLIV